MGEVVCSLSADIKYKGIDGFVYISSRCNEFETSAVLLHSEPSETLRPKQETNPQEAWILI